MKPFAFSKETHREEGKEMDGVRKKLSQLGWKEENRLRATWLQPPFNLLKHVPQHHSSDSGDEDSTSSLSSLCQSESPFVKMFLLISSPNLSLG